MSCDLPRLAAVQHATFVFRRNLIDPYQVLMLLVVTYVETKKEGLFGGCGLHLCRRPA